MISDPSPSPDEIHAEASRWTLHGISLLERGDRDALMEAQLCFEQAISMREGLPLEQNPLYRWGLTAGWMNRADALTRLGGQERLKEAMRCYDIAISHLHRLPLDADPAYRWRLSVAWMNRGITRQQMSGESSQLEALRSFDTALQCMMGHEATPRLDYQQVLAGAWMNRANALTQLSEPRWTDALDSARQAIRHSRTCEAQDRTAAEAGIKARHVLCRSLAHLLETPPVETRQADEWIHEATDAVEDVMHLTKDDAKFVTLREELFHFGCRIYRAFQPHFLAEFVNEEQAAGPMSEAMTQAARESLAQAAFHIQQENLAGYTPSRLDRLIETLRTLSEVGSRLAPGKPPGA